MQAWIDRVVTESLNSEFVRKKIREAIKSQLDTLAFREVRKNLEARIAAGEVGLQGVLNDVNQAELDAVNSVFKDLLDKQSRLVGNALSAADAKDARTVLWKLRGPLGIIPDSFSVDLNSVSPSIDWNALIRNAANGRPAELLDTLKKPGNYVTSIKFGGTFNFGKNPDNDKLMTAPFTVSVPLPGSKNEGPSVEIDLTGFAQKFLARRNNVDFGLKIGPKEILLTVTIRF